MAELDLYQDLYGDVDDGGNTDQQAQPSPLPASEQPPAVSAPTAPGTTPATFSIATYEESTGQSHSYKYSRGVQDSTKYPQQANSQTYEGHEAYADNQGQPAGSSQSANECMLFSGVKPSDMPDEGKMFVGGLNWETTDETLKQYFSQFGPVVYCTVMRDPANGKSRGFAFLTFADPAAVNNVMVREHFLDGKLIDPKRAIPRGGQEHGGNKRNDDVPLSSNKLFVRGMPEDATPTSFKAFWNQYASRVNIIESILMMDRESNRHRGFGFVNLETGEDADQLLKLVPFIMDNHPLEVKKAQNRTRKEGRDETSGSSGQQNIHQTTSQSHSSVDMSNTMGSGTPFDPSVMANFFQNMGPQWKNWNPAMYMGGMMPFNPMMMNQGMGMMNHHHPVTSHGHGHHQMPLTMDYNQNHGQGLSNHKTPSRGGSGSSSSGPSRSTRGGHGFHPY